MGVTVENNKQNFLEKVEKNVVKTLKDELGSVSFFGKPVTSSNFNQCVLNAEVHFDEICHIRPEKPLFKPGTLLISPEGIRDEDSYSGSMMKCADEDSRASINIGVIKDITELGESRRYLVAENIMVTEESIQIRKSVSIKANNGSEISSLRHNCIYTIRHLIHGLDNKRKVFIPTKMFKEEDGRFASDLIMFDQLDLQTILQIYNSSSASDIVSPLKIHKQ